jgi:hypothetical protein
MLPALTVVLATTTASFLVLAVLDLFRFVPDLDTADAASREQASRLFGPPGMLAILADLDLSHVAPFRTWPRAPAAREHQAPSPICAAQAGPIPAPAMARPG